MTASPHAPACRDTLTSSRREGAHMRPADLANTLAGLLKGCGHPDIADVQVLPSGTLRVDFTNGSTIFASAAHVAPAKASTPSSPSWPGATRATADSVSSNGRRQ